MAEVRNKQLSPIRGTPPSKDSKEDSAGDPRIAYSPRPDATPDSEVQVLAAVYAFVLRRHEQKEAAGADGEEEGGAR